MKMGEPRKQLNKSQLVMEKPLIDDEFGNSKGSSRYNGKRSHSIMNDNSERSERLRKLNIQAKQIINSPHVSITK